MRCAAAAVVAALWRVDEDVGDHKERRQRSSGSRLRVRAGRDLELDLGALADVAPLLPELEQANGRAVRRGLEVIEAGHPWHHAADDGDRRDRARREEEAEGGDAPVRLALKAAVRPWPNAFAARIDVGVAHAPFAGLHLAIGRAEDAHRQLGLARRDHRRPRAAAPLREHGVVRQDDRRGHVAAEAVSGGDAERGDLGISLRRALDRK
mmetsp:Transcript_28309/g.90693  ORF Transcript_28309/g.90693 Transcript_28309/m.90693 type:complete len:209 (+) Transcript_28309:149-775(+)